MGQCWYATGVGIWLCWGARFFLTWNFFPLNLAFFATSEQKTQIFQQRQNNLLVQHNASWGQIVHIDGGVGAGEVTVRGFWEMGVVAPLLKVLFLGCSNLDINYAQEVYNVSPCCGAVPASAVAMCGRWSNLKFFLHVQNQILHKEPGAHRPNPTHCGGSTCCYTTEKQLGREDLMVGRKSNFKFLTPHVFVAPHRPRGTPILLLRCGVLGFLVGVLGTWPGETMSMNVKSRKCNFWPTPKN